MCSKDFCCVHIKKNIENEEIDLRYFKWDGEEELDMEVNYDTGELSGTVFLNFIKFCPWCGTKLDPKLVVP